MPKKKNKEIVELMDTGLTYSQARLRAKENKELTFIKTFPLSERPIDPFNQTRKDAYLNYSRSPLKAIEKNDQPIYCTVCKTSMRYTAMDHIFCVRHIKRLRKYQYNILSQRSKV